MSAYIVSNKTISAIAKAFVDWGVGFLSEDYAPPIGFITPLKELYEAVGQSLLNQNYASVNCRYGEETPTPKFTYEEVDINEGIVYGCIANYNYQACETPDYWESHLYRSLVDLKEFMLKRFIKRSGYDIPYGLD